MTKDYEEEITLSALSRTALEQREGDVDEAVEDLVYQLQNDEELLNDVVSAAVREACKSFVSKAHRDQRARIISGLTNKKSTIGEAAIALVKENIEHLMNYPLMGGVKLKDATRPQLIEQAEFHAKIEYDAGWKKTWFRNIASHLNSDKQKVKSVLSVETVYSLYEEARNQ
jgi:hypothetical protein